MATVNSSNYNTKNICKILWLDSEVNNSEENLTTQQKLFHAFDNVEVFEDENVCQQFIESEQEQPILLIVSGRLSRRIIPTIDRLEHVLGIYIYCMDKSRHEEWAKDFVKIKGIIVKLEELLSQIKIDLKTLINKKESKIKTVSSSTIAAASATPKPVTNKNVETTQNLHVPVAAASVNKTSCALDGYEKMPLCSLEEAVAPLTEIVADIEQMVWIVKQNSQNPEEGLTSDESASIALYTMEWYPKEKSFFYILNDTLRSENKQQIEPWFRYLKLVFHSLSKLKTISHIVYNGTNADVTANYPNGKTFISWEFLSCTSSIQTLENEENFGKEGQRTLFTIECRSGKDISRHAFDQSKEQVLLLPGRQFQVISCLNPGDELNIVQMKEMNSPFSF